MNGDLNSILYLLMIFILTIFTLLLLHIGKHTKSNIYLAIYFISQILGILSFFISPTSKTSNLFYSITQAICYTWGALFYLFISSLLNPKFKLRRISVFHFIPALVVFIILVFHFNSIFKQTFISINSNLFIILSYLFNILIIGYNIAIIYKYFKSSLKEKGVNKPTYKNASTIWIKISVFGFIVSCFVVQIHNIHILESLHLNYIGNVIFLAYFSVLLYVAILNRTITDKIEIVEKYKRSSLKSSISNEILEQIENCMLEDRLYTNPDLSLRNLAVILNIQEKYISEVINKLKGENFSEFVNSYRVSYAMRLLEKDENKDKTMLYILYEAGFNSKTTFNTTFKKVVGCTPIDYKNRFLECDI